MTQSRNTVTTSANFQNSEPLSHTASALQIKESMPSAQKTVTEMNLSPLKH